MTYAVRYYTKTGNTKRLAEAVAEALGVEALPISEPVTEPVDLLLLGNLVGRIANFGTAAMMKSTRKKVKAEADKIGIPVIDSEFHCRGEFKGANKGRPDANDLAAAKAWAKTLK